MCWRKIKDAWHLFKEGLAGAEAIRQTLEDSHTVILGLQPLIQDMAPLVKDIVPLLNDIAPLIRDMQPVLADIQNIVHDVQPVVHDSQKVVHDGQQQWHGPDLQGWEVLGRDATGAYRDIVASLAYLHDLMGEPRGLPPGSDLFSMLQTIANALAPLANILPHPFGVPGQPPP